MSGLLGAAPQVVEQGADAAQSSVATISSPASPCRSCSTSHARPERM